VISAIRGGLKQYASNSLLDNGRATWPTDPFTALSEKPAGHTNDGDLANADGEWTFIDNLDGTGRITHQRADNSRYYWEYDSGIQEDDDADTAQIGSLGPRQKVGEEPA
jgi:hypothetical protein